MSRTRRKSCPVPDMHGAPLYDARHASTLLTHSPTTDKQRNVLADAAIRSTCSRHGGNKCSDDDGPTSGVMDRGVKSDAKNGEESGERRQRLNNGGFVSGGSGRREGQARRLTLKDLVYEMQTNKSTMDITENNGNNVSSVRNDIYDDYGMNSDSYEYYSATVYEEKTVEGSGGGNICEDGGDIEAIVRTGGENVDNSGGSKTNGDTDDGNGESSVKIENRPPATRKRRDFLEFVKARHIVRALNLKSRTQWQKWSKSKRRPLNIPSHPEEIYGREWRGYGDWLGTGTIANNARVFLSFTEAREKVRALNLKTQKEYDEWSRSRHRPMDIPSCPNVLYQKEWQGWGDWIGTGRTTRYTCVYLSFTEARDIVRTWNLTGQKEWRWWSKSKLRPLNIPSDPGKIYKQDFRGLGDWLGTGTIASFDRVFRRFTEARAIVRALNLKSNTEWHAWAKSEDRPMDIPSHPDRTYKDEWQGWEDWIGTGRITNKNCNFLRHVRKSIES